MSRTDLFRILDANGNRAREALRVMEEYARFVLDDAGLTARIKDARHALADVLRATEQAADRSHRHAVGRVAGESELHSASELLIKARDIVGDVGREVGTDTEYRRESLGQVALAACRRLSEALRVIEEYVKTLDADLAKRVERIRYQGYELERQLLVTTETRKRFGHVRLYVIVTEALCRKDWFDTAQAALAGGADALQLREKNVSDLALLERGTRLAKLCHEHGALFFVNDRADVAVACGADGVHLGQDDVTVPAARRLLPGRMLIGLSTHTPEQVHAAAEAAPDYIAVGPMFPTETKPQAHIAGPGTLVAARACTSLPLVAIGGITERNVGEVISAAPCAVCVCSAVIAAAEVESACVRVRQAIDRAFESASCTELRR